MFRVDSLASTAATMSRTSRGLHKNASVADSQPGRVPRRDSDFSKADVEKLAKLLDARADGASLARREDPENARQVTSYAGEVITRRGSRPP
jgi:hypothetical protein